MDAHASDDLTEPSETVTGTWIAGQRQGDEGEVWDKHASAFLGCGYRVVVPSHGGVEALAFARLQADQLSALLDVATDPAPWQVAESLVARGAPLLIEGGWESVFRGPLGPPRTRVSIGRGPVPERHLPALELPWRVATGSRLSTLPLISTHEHRAALAHLHTHRRAGAVGLWRAPDATLVGSTAGAILAVSAEAGWQHAAPSAGVVPSWIATGLAALLESTPTRLESTAGLHLIAVDPWGSLTLLTPPDHRCGDPCATPWADEARTKLASLLASE